MLAPDRRDPARAVTLWAKRSAPREPSGNATAALPNWALIENEKQLKKKRAELARIIIERLQDPHPASPGMLKGLRQDQALLEQQIAELERLS